VQIDIWRYREDTWSGIDTTGYKVEALDGSIGKVDRATNDVAGSTIVVDTGPWIFGKKVVLPGGVIDRIDPDDETVYVNRTKDEIKNAPEFDDSMVADEGYRGELAGYYGPGGSGWRDYGTLP
jgi:hypothetical protein